VEESGGVISHSCRVRGVATISGSSNHRFRARDTETGGVIILTVER